MSDIGAIEPGSWHDWHFAWRIGATSRVIVTDGPIQVSLPTVTSLTIVAFTPTHSGDRQLHHRAGRDCGDQSVPGRHPRAA